MKDEENQWLREQLATVRKSMDYKVKAFEEQLDAKDYYIKKLRDQLKQGEDELSEAHEKGLNQLQLREEKIKFWVTHWNKQANEIAELKEALKELCDGIEGLPPRTAIAGTLTRQYSKARKLLDE